MNSARFRNTQGFGGELVGAHVEMWWKDLVGADGNEGVQKTSQDSDESAAWLRIPIDVAHDSGMMSPAIPR
jgi:hypothetical protein